MDGLERCDERGPRLRRQHLEGGDELELAVARTAVAASLFTSLAAPHTTVGRYVLRHRLGAGGMGVVFAAHDPSLKRDLAIKLLRARDPDADALLLKEAQSTAQLVHPAVVTIFDLGLHEGRVFIAMEHIAGQSMDEWLRTRPPWRHGVAVLARAARGLEAAHARGLIHRDFKPANVLLGRDGRVCVADFGLARDAGDTGSALADAPSGDDGRPATRSRLAGTPAYMAPEQYLRTAQDERTDQFAFCASLYQALFGRRPFEGTTIAALKEQILTAQPAIPRAHDVPQALLDAVSRGLSKSRRDRFASMGELATLLESHSDGVDLARVLGDREPRADRARESMYEAYLRQLPDGLDSCPDIRLPSRIYQVILAHRPLRPPPPELAPIIAGLPATAAIPVVHARAILNAVYDAHFASLEAWREFVGGMCQGAMKLLMTTAMIPRPSSPYFVRGLVAAYNNRVSGSRVDIVEESEAGSATVRFVYTPNTLNEVGLVAWEEIVRAVMIDAGCRVVELVTFDRTEGSFLLKAHWR